MRCWSSAGTCAQISVGATRGVAEAAGTVIEFPPSSTGKPCHEQPSYLASPRQVHPSRHASLLSQAFEKLGDQAKSVKVQQVRSVHAGCRRSCRCIVGATHGNGGMRAIWQLDNEIGISAAADPHDRDLLAAQWVMGMGNSYRFRSVLG